MLHYKAFLTVLVNIYITLLFTEVEVASDGLFITLRVRVVLFFPQITFWRYKAV